MPAHARIIQQETLPVKALCFASAYRLTPVRELPMICSMPLSVIFQRLVDLERVAAGFYRLAARNAGTVGSSWAQRFEQMEAEEYLHQRQIEMTRDLARAAEGAVVEISGGIEGLETLIGMIRSRIGRMEASLMERIDPLQLAREALEMERGMEARHAGLCLEIRDPGLRKLFENLQRGDSEHLERLERQIRESEASL